MELAKGFDVSCRLDIVYKVTYGVTFCILFTSVKDKNYQDWRQRDLDW